MYEKFVNEGSNVRSLEITDEALIITEVHDDAPSKKYIVPYGAFKKVKISLGVMFEIETNNIGQNGRNIRLSFPIAINAPAEERKKLKELVPVITRLNASAPKTTFAVEELNEVKQDVSQPSGDEAATDEVNVFRNPSGNILEISDEGIIVTGTKADGGKSIKIDKELFPYGSLRDIKVGFLGFSFWHGKELVSYVPSDKEQKAKIQKLLPTIVQRNASSSKEYRKKCTVCGHVFCYTDEDLRQNLKNAKMGIISSVGTIAAATGGNAYAAYENNKLTEKNKSKIIDYKKCPNCNSTHLVDITEEEFAQEANKNNPSSSAEPAVSAADEIKKFKELFDMGVITQEEFDAKKKQLLGL